MSKMPRFIRRTSPLIRWLILAIIALVGTLIALLIMRVMSSRMLSTAWLPNVDAVSDESAYYDIPVSSTVAVTKYGKAQRFDSTNRPWSEGQLSTKPVTSIYEFSSGASLNEASCPNILDIESVLPSPCHQVGSVQSHPIYAISRRLPSMMTEYFVRFDNIFVFVTAGVDGEASDRYVKTFERLNRKQVGAYLQKNKQRVDQLVDKQHTADNAEKTRNAAAYTKLDFTPAMPDNLPNGWRRDPEAAHLIEIDGPDADHPSLVSTEYTNDKKQFVSFHSGRLSDYTLGPTCGPTPGSSMEALACVKPAGKPYYEAARTLDTGDLVRTLYYPVGDSLVITQIQVFPEDGKPVAWPTDLANIQDQLTLGSRPVSKDSLKGSTYNAVYYR